MIHFVLWERKRQVQDQRTFIMSFKCWGTSGVLPERSVTSWALPGALGSPGRCAAPCRKGSAVSPPLRRGLQRLPLGWSEAWSCQHATSSDASAGPQWGPGSGWSREIKPGSETCPSLADGFLALITAGDPHLLFVVLQFYDLRLQSLVPKVLLCHLLLPSLHFLHHDGPVLHELVELFIQTFQFLQTREALWDKLSGRVWTSSRTCTFPAPTFFSLVSLRLWACCERSTWHFL